MRPCVIVVVDKFCQRETGVCEGVKAVAPTKFFFEGFDEAFAKSILLGSVWRDVFLFKSVIFDH